MARMKIKVSRKVLFTWFLLAGSILLLTPQKLTNKLQLSFARIFSLPLKIGHAISLSVQRNQPSSDYVSRREYNKLHNHLVNINEQLVQANRKIEDLTGLAIQEPFRGAKFALADVVKFAGDELLISRGKSDGIIAGQFVLCDNSIVGTISEVFSTMSKIKLITSPKSQIKIRVAGESGVLSGNGDGTGKIRFISKTKKIKSGDSVFADRKAGFLNSPMVLGRVSECRFDDDNRLFWDITVEPVCRLEEITDVAVVIMKP